MATASTMQTREMLVPIDEDRQQGRRFGWKRAVSVSLLLVAMQETGDRARGMARGSSAASARGAIMDCSTAAAFLAALVTAGAVGSRGCGCFCDSPPGSPAAAPIASEQERVRIGSGPAAALRLRLMQLRRAVWAIVEASA
jgi:hypothetical protein